MARVTVEDCVQLVPNRFELVMISAQRARDIHAGAEIRVAKDNDKTPVIALREIADKKLDLDAMRETLISGHQLKVDNDLPEDDIIEMMTGEQGGWIEQSNDDKKDPFAMAEDDDAEDDEADEEAGEEDGEAAADAGDAPVVANDLGEEP